MPSEPAISPDDLHTRIGLLFALLVIGAVPSLFPVLCSRLRRKKKGASAKEAAVKKPWKDIVFSLLNCFAGGVFLGVTFLHLLPDITTDWEKIFSQIWPCSYPFDKFLVVIGFFVVLIIEQMAYTCQRARPRKKTERVVASPPPSPMRVQPNIVAAIDTEVTPLLRDGEGNAGNWEQCRQEHARHTQADVASDSEAEFPTQNQLLSDLVSARYSSPNSVEVQNCNGKDEEDTEEGGDGKGVGKGVQRKDEATSPGGLRAVFFGLALAVHSVFEGLAFGLTQSENDVGPRTLMCT